MRYSEKRLSVVKIERVVRRIRGVHVMLDADLAPLYGVTVGALNQAVKRNRARFPADFMFRLRKQEAECLKSQTVISNVGRGGRRTRPHAFTEHGVAMLSSVLRSSRAVAVNIEIMRAFVRLRRWMTTHKQLVERIDRLEAKCDDKFSVVFEAIREILRPPVPPRRPIGFRSGASAINPKLPRVNSTVPTRAIRGRSGRV